MASVSNPTFGCGNFLPGFGPFSIPEYDGPYNPVGVPGGGGGPGGPGGPQEEDVVYNYCWKNAPGYEGYCGSIVWPAPPAPPPTKTQIPGGADKIYPLGSDCLAIDLGDPNNNPSVPQACYDPPRVPDFDKCRCCIISETYGIEGWGTNKVVWKHIGNYYSKEYTTDSGCRLYKYYTNSSKCFRS